MTLGDTAIALRLLGAAGTVVMSVATLEYAETPAALRASTR
jgi:hypothetical protein